MELKINTPIGLAGAITGYKYMIPRHLQFLEQVILDAVVRNKTKRIIVSMPPRHGKSEYLSKYLPAWLLMNYPWKRAVLVSYEASFAASWCSKSREVFQEMNQYKLKTAQQAFWEIEGHGGSLSAVGIGGPLTGKGAYVIIIDDPTKNAEEANSKTIRTKQYDWFNSVAYTRLEPNGIIILLMTRWHQDDLAGKLQRESPEEWTVINLPAIAELNDVLGRKPGEPLWPERFGIEKLKTIKEQVGSYWFAALYQQRPIAGEFQMFKPDWFNTYRELPSTNFTVQSWDTAFKDKEHNDYSVCSTWAITEKGYYLIDLFRKKMLFPELLKQTIAQYNKHMPNVVLIEDKASGQSLIQSIRQETRIPIKAVKVDVNDKVARANLVTPLFEAGKVFFREDIKDLSDIYTELEDFPHGVHDDIVDSFTQALEYLRKRAPKPSVGRVTTNRKRESNPFTGY